METQSLDRQIIEKYLELLSGNEIDDELIQKLRENLEESTIPDYRQYKKIIEAYLSEVGDEV